MSVDPRLLELPTASYIAVIIVIFIFLTWLVTYLILRKRQHRLAEIQISWLNLLNYAQKRDILGREIRPLKAFFRTLTPEERKQIPGNQQLFRKLFVPFINSYPGISGVEKVKYIEKLVPESPVHVEIESPRDLYSGEAVAIEFNGKNYLAFVVQVKGNLGTFSLANFSHGQRILGQEVTVHAYRHQHGTYALEGVIQKIYPDGFSVLFSDKVRSTGDEHLMATLSWKIELIPWPELIAPKEDLSPEQEKPQNLEGESEKISDRAMLVSLNTNPAPEILRRQDLWELHMVFPDGEPVKFRVKLFPSPQQKGKYILRYVDINEPTRIKLWEIIKDHNPQRERIN
ncbi:MAG: hypothetical protein NZM25_08885 [Leptospiraceae bacterium]|nr:hypothetical protein [Leptospiraceae bacterium]MDW8306833.1 hypothetical protein [Leptospiraceae bacterium]